MENKIMCRKCGGPHLTIKCGKEKQPIVESGAAKQCNEPLKKKYFKTTYRVKLSELPIDMTDEEMMELTCDWGHVVKIRVLNYPESSVAYIDFGYIEEAAYFVKSIDKTPFESLILSAQQVESYRQ
jgi:hypothetical protein